MKRLFDGSERGKWDRAGVLSIAVQGALFHGNMVEVANNCRHWRELFPAAEIILVISVTDVVVRNTVDGAFTKFRLVAKHRHDGHLQAALDVIQQSCDKVSLAEPALPLPPIKSDSPKLNNMNFQISAAQHGLALATGLFVLRIRSDMIFLDRSFLDQYADGAVVPRGAAAVFTKRVMISWLYTLNPFTIERMPLHFSDWFHFGLREDVIRIWSIPQVTLRDSLYYKTHPHAEHSNAAERLFNIRIAVEQHVTYHCFKKYFPDLVLDYHNDDTSIDLAMDILIDNFVVCDIVRAHCVFDKYAQEFVDESKRIHCITAEDWLAMAQPRNYRTMLSHGLDRPKHVEQAQQTTIKAIEPPKPESAAAVEDPGFPRVYEAARLKTRQGQFADGKIVATATDGVIAYGPYISLAPGQYLAAVSAGVKGPGTLTLRVTLDSGDTLLAEKKFVVGRVVPELEIPFDIPSPGGSELEVVCSIKGLRDVTVSSITISERVEAEPAKPKWFGLKSAFRG